MSDSETYEDLQNRIRAMEKEGDKLVALLRDERDRNAMLQLTYDAAARENKDPIPMILHCPECHARHVDAGEFASKPHHTHACQRCGFTWRPAVRATVGVQFLPGFKDTHRCIVCMDNTGKCPHR